MAIFDFLRKKEPELPVVKDGKGAAEVRSITERIAAKLSEPRFAASADVTGRISQEQMDKYHYAVDNLRTKIGRTTVLRLDTSAIDQKILFLASYLPDAIRNGNQKTADRIVKGLTYGIIRGRQDIEERDIDRSLEIVDKRCRRLDMYRDIIELSKKIDDLEKTMRLQERELEKHQKTLAELEKVLLELSANTQLVNELATFGSGSDQLSPEARELDNKRAAYIALSKSILNLKRIKATNEASMTQQNAQINTLEIQLTQAEGLVDEQTLEDIRKQQEIFRTEILRQEQQIREMETMNKEFDYAMASIYSSPELVNTIVEHDMEYEQLVKAKADREAGMREAAENRARNQQTNERLIN